MRFFRKYFNSGPMFVNSLQNVLAELTSVNLPFSDWYEIIVIKSAKDNGAHKYIEFNSPAQCINAVTKTVRKKFRIFCRRLFGKKPFKVGSKAVCKFNYWL